MIVQQPSFDKLPYKIKKSILDLNVLKHLSGMDFKKKFGFNALFIPL